MLHIYYFIFYDSNSIFAKNNIDAGIRNLKLLKAKKKKYQTFKQDQFKDIDKSGFYFFLN